jgi:anti-anti-sigma factor
MHTELGITCDPPKARLRLSGEFDLSTNERVSDLFGLAEARGCRHVELDLSGVSFIDVGTLYVLDAQRRRITSGGGSFVVVAESPCYRRVCDMAHYVVLTVDGQSAAPTTVLRRPHVIGERPRGRPPARPHHA